jgi:hypothetical protein
MNANLTITLFFQCIVVVKKAALMSLMMGFGLQCRAIH